MRALLVAAALLAGCTTLAPAPEPTTKTHPWGLDACTFVIANVKVDAARLQARLPAGFSLAPTEIDALPAGPDATLAFDAYRCDEGAGFNGTLRDLSYGSHYAAVRPPPELAQTGYDAVFVKWDPLIPDTPRRDVLVAAGMAAHDGEANVQISGPQVTASLTFADGGGFTLTGIVGSANAQEAPLPFMEYTPLAGGTSLARWHARLHDASIGQGAGTVQVLTPWAREVVGNDRAPAQFIAGTWNLDEADVTWPVER